MSLDHVNLAVVVGRCSSPPEVRELPSGQRVANLAVTAKRSADEAATSVPVAIWQPPAWVETLAEGDEVVAVGRVRRRFWRSASGIGSRVELEADTVARAGDARRRRVLLRRIHAWLDPFEQ